MAYRNDTFGGGFADPVFNAQSTFKSLMDAMARPGTLVELGSPASPPSPMGKGAGAIALTLCDHDTPVHLSPAMIEGGVQSWLAFQTGALVSGDRSEAAFAFLECGATLPALSTYAQGSQEHPDRSTTLVVELPGLSDGPVLVLSGPGIEGRTTIAPAGLPAHFARMWAANAALYPRGIDLILVSGTTITCLPRTTQVASEAI